MTKRDRVDETPFMRWLEELLAHKGWSGNALGLRCDVSGQTISQWRHGIEPKREHVVALSEATGVPEDDINALLLPNRESQRSLASYLAGALPRDMTRLEARLLVHVAHAYRDWAREVAGGPQDAFDENTASG
jgi:transcriptional regulator with XRE-family HTH domain